MTPLIWEILIFVLFLAIVAILISKGRADGTIHVHKGEDKDTYLFEFDIPPEKIPTMKAVVFKVSVEEDHSQNIQPT